MDIIHIKILINNKIIMANEKLKEYIKKIKNPKELDELLSEIYKIKRWNSTWQWGGSWKKTK